MKVKINTPHLSHEEEDYANNRQLDYIIEKVVKPLYGKE